MQKISDFLYPLMVVLLAVSSITVNIYAENLEAQNKVLKRENHRLDFDNRMMKKELENWTRGENE